MLTDESDLLQGIVEADETYVVGKPRKKNKNSKHGLLKSLRNLIMSMQPCRCNSS